MKKMIVDMISSLSNIGGEYAVVFVIYGLLLISLFVGLTDDEKVGTPRHRMAFISFMIWTAAWVLGMFYTHGRGIVW